MMKTGEGITINETTLVRKIIFKLMKPNESKLNSNVTIHTITDEELNIVKSCSKICHKWESCSNYLQQTKI